MAVHQINRQPNTVTTQEILGANTYNNQTFYIVMDKGRHRKMRRMPSSLPMSNHYHTRLTRLRIWASSTYPTFNLFSNMGNTSYQSSLETGKVVIRKWWFNQNSEKNQCSVQFQQQVEKPTSNNSVEDVLISIEQGSQGFGNTTNVTAIRSYNADRIAELLGSTIGDCTAPGATQHFADILYTMEDGTIVDTGVEVTENFTKNPYSTSQTPKVNPKTGEIVTAVNPVNGALMPVYRHTKLTSAGLVEHSFVIPSKTAGTQSSPANPKVNVANTGLAS